MLTREFSADATPCQRRVALQWVAAGVLLPTWATWAAGAQAQMGLSGAINYAGWFRALSQRMAQNLFKVFSGSRKYLAGMGC
jgi:hypothetical protein